MKRRKCVYLVVYDAYRDNKRVEHISTNVDFVFKKLDDAYRYIETYKDHLHKIMLKSELKDNLNKCIICDNVADGEWCSGYTFVFSILKKPIH